MTGTPQAWLPSCALTSPIAVQPVAGWLDEWSREWLLSDRLTPAPGWREADAGRSGQSWRGVERTGADRVQISQAADTAHLLAGAMLGQPLTDRDIRTPADRMVIGDLVKSAMDDLSERLSRAFRNDGQMGPDGNEPAYSLAVFLHSGPEILTIAAPRSFVTRLAQDYSGPPRDRPQPGPMAPAIARQQIGISAVIGNARIGLKELERLGVGDVIPLGIPTDSLLALGMGDTLRSAPAATLALQGERFGLQIERHMNEW